MSDRDQLIEVFMIDEGRGSPLGPFKCSDCDVSFRLSKEHPTTGEEFAKHANSDHPGIPFRQPEIGAEVGIPGIALGKFRVYEIDKQRKTAYLRGKNLPPLEEIDARPVPWEFLSYTPNVDF